MKYEVDLKKIVENMESDAFLEWSRKDKQR
jgi:hypothetical protein